MREAMYHILEVAVIVSPTDKEQQAFARIYRDMQDAGESPKSIIVALAGAVQDGLKHGNWPE